MTIWFTADTHFCHKNIIEYSSRPFASLEEMTEAMIERWNAAVTRGDSVYHLGDFAMSFGPRDYLKIDGILKRLHGQKFLVEGNHDRKEVTQNSRWIKVSPYMELSVDLGGVHRQRIVLFHYSMRVWNQIHRGAWQLYGHSHGNLSDIGGKTMDVGVDCHGFRPISLEEVRQFMEPREVVVVDHHRLDEETDDATAQEPEGRQGD